MRGSQVSDTKDRNRLMIPIRIRSIARSDTQKRDRLGTTRRLPVPGTPPSPARSEADVSGMYSTPSYNSKQVKR